MKKKQIDFSKSFSDQSPNNCKVENSSENYECNSINSVNLVEQKVKKIASAFGLNSSMSNFLEKTTELKIIPNIAHLSHTKDLFSQMVQEVQHIKVRNYLPKDLNILSSPIMQQRLKSMKQARTFELAINFMKNEFENFNYNAQKNFEDLEHQEPDKIDNLCKENNKLRSKINFLQKQIKEQKDEISVSKEKKDLILQIKDLLKDINSQKENNIEEISIISDKFDIFFESRNKLLISYNAVNKQVKKMEKAKFSILEKNAKTVTIKGKIYNEKMINDEIMQLMSKKENILSGLGKIETHEKKFISSMKSTQDE